jgi:ABC-2 type transport system ATP-binding protein
MCHRVAILQNGRLIRVQSLRRADWDAQDVAVEFEVDPADASAATAVLKEASGLLRTEDEGRAVIVRTKRDRVPDLNARLVSAGVRVYGIRTMERSLEEEFLEATRGTPTARDFERSPDGQVRTSASGIGSTAAEKGDGDAGSDPQ